MAKQNTWKYKAYTWVTRADQAPIGDVEGHNVGFSLRGIMYVFENGEAATGNAVVITDTTNFSGTIIQYVTINFSDNSTMIVKLAKSTAIATPSGSLDTFEGHSEIIKGTGRFAGIKGTVQSKIKYFPVEPGEAGPKGYGEGAMTFTLPAGK